MKLLDRFKPLQLASVGIVAATLPLYVVAAPVPWPVVALAVVCCGLFIPLLNAPVLGLITTRPPAALRAKVITAGFTASALGGPAGRLVVGPVYRWAGNTGVWIEIAGGMSVGALLFLAAVWRSSPGDAADVAAMAAVAQGEPQALGDGPVVQLGAEHG